MFSSSVLAANLELIFPMKKAEMYQVWNCMTGFMVLSDGSIPILLL